MLASNFERDILREVELTQALQTDLQEWKLRMEACRELKKRYEDSPFAQDYFKEYEKKFKRRYWEANERYKKYQKEFFGA